MREITSAAPVSPRVADLCAALGVSLRHPHPLHHRRRRTEPRLVAAARTLAALLEPGTVVAVTGPSGGGKSTLLRALARRIRRPVALAPTRRVAAVDALGVGAAAALEALARAGLAEAGALVRLPGELSDGQRHRLAVARAMASRSRGPVLIDEFGSTLDRTTAMGLCLSLARWAARRRRTVVCATAHDDVIAWLRPHLHAVVPLEGPVEIVRLNTGG